MLGSGVFLYSRCGETVQWVLGSLVIGLESLDMGGLGLLQASFKAAFTKVYNGIW